MNYLIAAQTDVGIVKNTNQDSLTIQIMDTPQGRMAFAALCDGMGGLDKGEVASASVIRAFSRWVREELPELVKQSIEDFAIRAQWERIVREQNEGIKKYGAGQGVRLGTTVAALLLTGNRYYALNVGDSRIYLLDGELRQITRDQTFVEREVALGRMTAEEAAADERRNVLLQCVGASDTVYPDMFFGEVLPDQLFLLCSDGFRHEISAEEIYAYMQPGVMTDQETMNGNARTLIELNKQRKERDNISVGMIRTYDTGGNACLR